MNLIELIFIWFGVRRAEKKQQDAFFAHRAWAEGRISDEEYARYGRLAKGYIREKNQRYGAAPAAIGFRSRSFN